MSEPPNGNGKSGLINTLLSVAIVVMVAILGVFWSQISSLGVTSAANTTRLVAVCAALVEVETQFRASDQERNLMHKKDLELITVLWRQVYGFDYPGGAPYLPTIAQEQPAACR